MQIPSYALKKHMKLSNSPPEVQSSNEREYNFLCLFHIF